MNEYNQYIENAEKILMPIYDQLLAWALSPHTYYQMIFAVGAFLLAYSITKIIRRLFPAIKEPNSEVKTFSRIWFIHRSGRLVYPVLVIFFLAIINPITEHIIQNIEIIHSIQRVTIIWLLWVALRAYLTNALVRTVGIWILLPAALLQLFGWFEPVVSKLDDYGVTLGDVKITAYTLIKAVFFISTLAWIGKLISSHGEKYIRHNTTLTRATQELLIKLFHIILYATLIMTTLNLIGIDLTALTVFSGALGVGLGFGLQKIASNFVSGIILLTEKSININNLVEMDDNVFGYVRKLGARASIIETFDGKEVMIPNEDFITSRVANLTHSTKKGRIEIPVGVAYDSDLRQVYQLILDAANNYENAIQDDEDFKPKCFLREYGDNSVNFLLTFWLEDVTQGRWRAQSDVMFTIWDSFQEHNIEIPFPQRDLHIKSGLEAFQKN